jgi:hypothetical protein
VTVPLGAGPFDAQQSAIDRLRLTSRCCQRAVRPSIGRASEQAARAENVCEHLHPEHKDDDAASEPTQLGHQLTQICTTSEPLLTRPDWTG